MLPTQAPSQAQEPAVEDLATHDYQLLLPKFFAKVDELSNFQLKKVVRALVEYPLENQSFHWSYTKEYEAFTLGMKLFDCKFVIMKAVLDLKEDEINRLLKETDPNKGETNENLQSGLSDQGPGSLESQSEGSANVPPVGQSS